MVCEPLDGGLRFRADFPQCGTEGLCSTGAEKRSLGRSHAAMPAATVSLSAAG